MELKDIIKMKRTELGLSYEQLGALVGVAGSTVMRWEKGDVNNMKRSSIVSLSKALNISIEQIMGWEEKPKASDGYYLNDETAAIAQEMFENKELRALYDVQRDMTPLELRAMYGVALAMKRREEGEGNDDGC